MPPLKYAPAVKTKISSTRPQMSHKKMKGLSLDSRKELIFLRLPTGHIKWSREPDAARGPYIAHAWFSLSMQI